MPSIEFVDDEPPASQDDPTAHAQHTPHSPVSGSPDADDAPSWDRVTSAVLLTGAAGLLIAASFADVYRLRYVSKDDGDVQEETVDGWGRIGFRVRSGIDGQHATRFGIALCAIAGVLVLVALVDGLPRRHRLWQARARRWSHSVALVALSVGAGVLAAAVLELQAQRDNANAFSDGDIQLQQTVGAFFLLGSLALAVGACALLIPIVLGARRHEARLRAAPTVAREPGDAARSAPQADWSHG